MQINKTLAFSAIALASAATITATIASAGGAHIAETLYPASKKAAPVKKDPTVTYATVSIDNLDIFYREAGDPSNPTIVLLHGFPTSSHMFRDLIPKLADNYHVIAPDYPGYGLSSAPPTSQWDYSFDNLANVVDELLERKNIDSYALYVMDYGAPVGYRIATEHPDRVTALIVQNGNAYNEGLRDFWDPIKAYWAEPNAQNREALRGLLTLEATKWQYHHGTRNPNNIAPDNWLVIQPLLDRPGNNDIQLDLFLDYGSNPPLYPQWQQYFRDYQPPTLIVWGEHDPIFPAEGAHPYLRDLPDAELHLLNTGHFALEEDLDTIANLINNFMHRKVKR